MLRKIEIPKQCPACNSELEIVNDQLFCRNSSCSAKQLKAVHHFANTLKIKGLGPRSVEKLLLEDIIDIYQLDFETVASRLGSEKLAEKLMEEIEKSKKVSLNQLLPAFNIPLIGKTASDKLCSVIESIAELNEESCSKAGLGPKATKNLLDWFEKDFICYLDGALPFSYKTEKRTTSIPSKGVVCISGKLSSYSTKSEAVKVLESQGYTVKPSVTKDVTILVNESGIDSAKTKKARQNGLRIVNNINQLIGE